MCMYSKLTKSNYLETAVYGANKDKVLMPPDVLLADITGTSRISIIFQIR